MDPLPEIDTSQVRMPRVKPPRGPTIAEAYQQAHERAIRLAYAVAGAIEDYPMPVGTVPNMQHVFMLHGMAHDLALLAELLEIPESARA